MEGGAESAPPPVVWSPKKPSLNRVKGVLKFLKFLNFVYTQERCLSILQDCQVLKYVEK